ncbi:5'/3'-nucleotidase SurE [candidate division KSB1 bacterium]|nr:5'/3'-nucleotidase SurE [candidate division KSB1 bacterium]RQW01159.1 MAG: 5'/3'-nucleotidase SurE [candidate division KSB1 bacterium]
MKVLLTNDDGITAPGLAALANAISKIADTAIVAPATEMSAVGHAITLSDPLKVTEAKKNGKFFGHSVSGTPADCVKIAYWALMKDQSKPDLLISGINLGSNTGINTIYSGTVSAATEGAILGIPSFAISLTTFVNPDFSAAAQFAAKFCDVFLSYALPRGVYLNINVPAVPYDQIKGIQITQQGMAAYEEQYHVREDPYNRKYYWLTGEKKNVEADLNIDDAAVNNNYISITPVHYNLTYFDILEDMRSYNFNDKIGW